MTEYTTLGQEKPVVILLWNHLSGKKKIIYNLLTEKRQLLLSKR